MKIAGGMYTGPAFAGTGLPLREEGGDLLQNGVPGRCGEIRPQSDTEAFRANSEPFCVDSGVGA